MNRFLVTVSVLLLAIFAGQAWASEPTPWQMGLQPAASPTAAMIAELHDALLIVITVITVFVLGLLMYASIRFRESRNPTPSKTTHHALLEIAWTVVPVLILVAIAIPSMKLLYFSDKVEDGDMTLKFIGHQWYWEYQYPEHDDLAFESYLIPEEELKEGEPRLLTVDNRLVLPVNKNIHVLVTAGDVLHSFAMPSLGVKKDAVPGRLNETWMRIDRPGIYRGQCSEICGTGHGYMPVVIEAVSEEEFAAWVNEAKNEFAELNNRTIALSK